MVAENVHVLLYTHPYLMTDYIETKEIMINLYKLLSTINK